MSLVSTRERRPNAGNRMRELILREYEAEELFREVADDEDFVVMQEEEDYVDSDFDQNTESEDDNDNAEVQLRQQENQERLARKQRARKSTFRTFGAVVPRKRSRPLEAFSASSRELAASPAPKKKSSAAHLPMLNGIRSSSRSHTVHSKQALEQKLKEYELRKALQPKREKVVAEPKTQEELLADAQKIEEENLASLRAFELREAEKKRSARPSMRKRILGPFMRHISYTSGYNSEYNGKKLVAEVLEKDAENDLKESEVDTSICEENNTSHLLAKEIKHNCSQSTVQQSTTGNNGSSQKMSAERDISDESELLGNNQKQNTDQQIAGNIQQMPMCNQRVAADGLQEQRSNKEAQCSFQESSSAENADTREAHNLVIFADFPDEEEKKLFEEWRRRPLKIKKIVCPFTGDVAKYKDPATGVPYANIEGYKRIQTLLKDGYPWSAVLKAYTSSVDQRPAEPA